jgi:nitrate reductase NapA
VNRHSRGTWLNNLLHNIHLLVGKVGAPGNGALCLAGQPGAGGGVDDAGSLADSLPRGTVTSAEDRRLAERVWGLPAGRIDARPGRTALSMFRALDRGDVRFLWVQATNPMVSLPNVDRYRRGARRDDRFVVVSEAYPTPTTDIADVVLPAAMWIEREGVLGSAERRAQHFAQLVAPPGDAISDARQMIEVAKRLGFGALFPWAPDRLLEGIWEEYARFHEEPRHRLPPLAELRARPGVMWPLVRGRETRWRYSVAHDPAAAAARGGDDFDFYGHPDRRAWIWLRPYEPPAEQPDREYPFWLGTGPVLEQWGGGAMTRRVPNLHRAMPRAYVEMHAADARALGVRSGDVVRLVSRRGALELEARIDYRSQPARGRLWVPAFDEGHPVNRLTLDAACPLSGQPDYGKCAVRVERVARGAGT